MKTSDVELAPASTKKTRSKSLLLKWLLPKRKKSKKKFKAGTHLSADGGADSKTKVSQSISDVVRQLSADNVSRVGVHGDEDFYHSFQAEFGQNQAVWLSADIFKDQPRGAIPLTPAALKSIDAVVVGGFDVATKYRYTLRQMHAHSPEKPVHWVADGWEFCAGTAAIPEEVDNVDALVFNHFEDFFGIKDPIQFRFEIIAEGEVRRSYLILGPSQSTNLDLNALILDRKGAVCLKVYVTHPFLTRGRHYRFRICGDVAWKDSFTIIHGSHQFFKNPNKVQPFRLINSVVRSGSVVITVPNYDLDMGTDDNVVIGNGSEKRIQKRSRLRPVEEVCFPNCGERGNQRSYFAASYAGYGTSFWYAFDRGVDSRSGKQGSIAANHLCRVGVENRDDVLFTPDERSIVEKTIASGFMIHPCCLPVSAPDSPLAFGFNFDASNPPFDDYWIRFYDAFGRFVEEIRYYKPITGPVLIDDILASWSHPRKSEVAMALISPDHLKIGLAPQRLVTTADLMVRHRQTGDQDFTEFQSSWRNLGTNIPSLPHWLHPSIGIMGRTNLIGRVRTKNGFRTGVFIANASGNLNYDMQAKVDILAVNNDGTKLRHRISLPAFGTGMIWLDEVMPGLVEHVGASGMAALQVKSADADLTAHVIGVSPLGAVGLQHLWGY